MRPIHALLFFAALALALVVGLVTWMGRGAPTGPAAAPSTAATSGAPDRAAPAELAAAPSRPAEDRTASPVTVDPAGSTRAPAVEPPTGAAQALTGRVVDVAGQPVAGAVVYASGAGGIEDIALDEIDPAEMFWFQRAEARTGADGRFTIAPRAESKARLAVRAPGFAPLDTERAFSASERELGDLVLQVGVVLEGRVIDHLGRPVAGAELRRRRPDASPFVQMLGGGAVLARTDDAGRFRVDQLPAGPWAVRVTSEAYPDKDESGEVARPGEVVRALTFQLEEGFEIAGRITGASADELEGLSVVAAPRGSGGFGLDFGPMQANQRRAAPAKDGSFTLRGCRKDARYRVSAREGRGSPFRSPVRSAAVDAQAGERGVELVYHAETAITFQVIDARTGSPVTDMTVSAGGRWAAPLVGEDNRPVRSFPDGRVRYGALRLGGAGGKVTLQVEAPGYAPYERTDVTVVEGQENDLGRVLLERTTLVQVHVTALGTGEPVQGALVSLEEVTDEGGFGFGRRVAISVDVEDDGDLAFGGTGGAHRARTDGAGRASVSSFPGSRGRIVVRHRQFAEWRSDPFDLPVSADVEREIVISAGGTVVVTVVDPRGAPVAGEAVEHRAPGQDDGQMFFGPGGGDVTDAEGQLRFERQLPGRHAFRLRGQDGPNFAFGGGGSVRVRAARFGGEDAPAEAPWTEVDVTEGGTAEVRLVAPERARVTGRVREGGDPLAGATVTLQTGEGGGLPFFNDGPHAKTEGDGTYAIENVAVGEYRVVVSHPGRAMDHEAKASVRAGENALDVDLPLSIVEGRVTGTDGHPLPGVRVRAERADGGSAVREMMVFAMDTGDGAVSFGGGGGGTVTTDADGRYRLRGVQPDVDLTVVGSGGDVQRGSSDTFQVRADQVRIGVDLVLEKGVTLEVTCRRPDGSAAMPCEVRAELADGEGADTKMQITNGEGRARFQGLKPGRWRLTARNLGPGVDRGGAPPAEKTVDLAVGPPQQVALEVPGS